MTILLFASYKMKLKDQTWIEGSVNCTLTIENPSEYPFHMKELENILKKENDGLIVVIQNINTIEWKKIND